MVTAIMGGEVVADSNYVPREQEVPPSKVVHCRSVSNMTTSEELTKEAEKYGAVKDVMVMPRKGMALVEMEDVEGAEALVEGAAANPLVLHGRRILCNFSTSQAIDRQPRARKPHQKGHYAARHGRPHRGPFYPSPEPGATHVLQIHVHYPMGPITPDVINAICSQYGAPALRVAIIRKKNLRVLVEFDSVEAASFTKLNIDGKDIYANCCTLSVEYSTIPHVIVRHNSVDQCDFTFQATEYGFDASHRGSALANGMMARHVRYGLPIHNVRFNGHAYGSGLMGTCVIVYNLNEGRMNCDRLFALFGLYGDVVKVKFIPNKAGSALVQYRDMFGAENALLHLNDAPLFGKQLSVQPSRSPTIGGQMLADKLQDGTPVMADYSESRLNRFATPRSRSRIFKISPVLHFFNAPPSIEEEEIIGYLASAGAPTPESVRLGGKTANKSATGHIVYADVAQAMEAMVLANNFPLKEEHHDHGYHNLKLAFSPTNPAKAEAQR